MSKKSELHRGAPAQPTRLRRSPAAMSELKARMLARAREIHRDEGLEALSMRRLAEEFGLSTMAMYSYFRDKQALLSGLWVEAFEALVERLQAAAQPSATPLQRLDVHLRCLIAFWEERVDQYRLVYLSAAQTAGASDLVDLGRQPAYAQLLLLTRERVAACLQGQATGEPEESLLRMQTDLLVAQLLGYLQLTLGVARYPLLDREALRELLIQEILRSVGGAAQTPRRGAAQA
ncbi:TetR/AcrR family transcriptional regulator [Roseateles violae]|uniref:TetR/AcrR family transcriptional regulator n=1 Tax=Roseateles violae TaxID=3058042 RepID=A0ABT8DZ03_9BURK|nr:TetR/AcrR family transcriptional regulator [Pelomonas sp. PFR6]MDN3922808.1 TetR/AcrR family transcriptional regulator [Pelomonas sp. PFR6]